MDKFFIIYFKKGKFKFVNLAVLPIIFYFREVKHDHFKNRGSAFA